MASTGQNAPLTFCGYEYSVLGNSLLTSFLAPGKGQTMDDGTSWGFLLVLLLYVAILDHLVGKAPHAPFCHETPVDVSALSPICFVLGDKHILACISMKRHIGLDSDPLTYPRLQTSRPWVEKLVSQT